MHLAASFLIPVLLSVFFAALLTPIYSWLKQRRLPNGLALLLSIGLLLLVALFLLLLVGRSRTVLASSLDSYRDQFSQRQAELSGQIDGLIPYIGAVISMIPPILLAYAQGGLGLAVIIGLLAVVINAVSENILNRW